MLTDLERNSSFWGMQLNVPAVCYFRTKINILEIHEMDAKSGNKYSIRDEDNNCDSNGEAGVGCASYSRVLETYLDPGRAHLLHGRPRDC